MTDGAEFTLVETWRARGMGWSAVAKALGRSIDYTRASYDRTYRRPCAAPEPRPAAPRVSASPLPLSKIGRLMRVLYAAQGPVSQATIGFDPREAIGKARRRFGNEAIIWCPALQGWSLGEEGRRVAEQRYGAGA